MTPPLLSFAQNREDVVLFRVLADVERGRYVDVGAGDPTVNSNTRAFYDRGWRGVTADQVREYVDRQVGQRPDDIAVHARVGTVDDRAAVDVPRRRLDSLLADAGWSEEPIHFMSVDAEGTEQGILEGLDLRRWRPWVLLVDATQPDARAYRGWEPRVTGAGYHFCLFDGLNRFYVADEHVDRLGPGLSYPACVLDRFETQRGVDQHREIRRLLAERDRLAHDLAVRVDELVEAGGPIRPVLAQVEAASQAALIEAVQWRTRAVRDYPAAAAGYAGPGAGASPDEVGHLRRNIFSLQRQMEQMRRTLSWRVTTPLRTVRRLRGGVGRG